MDTPRHSTRWSLVLAAAMLLIAAVAWFVPVTREAIVFLWIPIVASVAIAGPRATALLAVWGGVLSLVVRELSGLEWTSATWIRQILQLALAVLVVYFSWMVEKQRRRVRQLAFTDSLTGLLNRRLLFDRLETLLRMRNRDGIGVLYLDLDGFRAVNNLRGHGVGDDLLVEVAQRLSGEMRAEDTVARFGGDEFVVMLPRIQDAEQLAQVGERIRAALARPYASAPDMSVACTIGAVVVAPDDDRSSDEIIDAADSLLMDGKRRQRGLLYT